MRARNVKPGFFKNEDVGQLPAHGRLLFIGLWCLADREGRLQDRPRQIRGEIFPYEMDVDVDKLLTLMVPKLIQRYEVKGEKFIQIHNFVKHQQPHYKEVPSSIPTPRGHKDSLYVGGGIPESMRQMILDKFGRKCKQCSSKSNLTIDHIKPRVLGGTNEENNLQVLCRKCNSSKNNRILAQASVKVDPTLGAPSSLNPDSPSLIPDVLIPESRITPPGVPYPLPDPAKNPTACLVVSYKTRKGVAYDSREWDSLNWGRCAAAAKVLLHHCQDLQTAESCLADIAKDFDAKEMTWTLETIAKHAPDWLKKHGRTNADTSRAGLRMAIARRKAEGEGQGGLVKATDGPLPLALRDGPDRGHGNEKDSDQ